MRNLFLLFGLLFFLEIDGFSQTGKSLTDSVYSIKEVTVSTKRLDNFSSGHRIQEIDSVVLQRYSSDNIGRLLGETGALQINTYGPGMSSILMRGTTASHTAVLWNGFNLQSMFNGGVDLSQIQSGFIDDIRIQSGGSSALFGSGAVGGIIHLNNKPVYNKGFNAEVRTGVGSFANKIYGANISYSDSNYSQVIKAYYTEAKNDYPYKYFGNIDTLTNAQRKLSGIMIGQCFKTSEHSELEAYFWNQNNSQNIMSTTSSESHNHTSDNNNLLNVGWKNITGKGTFSVRSGINHGLQVYNYTNKYKSFQYINDVEYNHRFTSSQLLNVGLNYTYEKGTSQFHKAHAVRNHYALFTSYKVAIINNLNVYSNLRNEIVNDVFSPLTYSCGIEYQPGELFLLRGNVSKNYRLPTFNDLYWLGGGNPDLKSETGICSELGASFTKKTAISRYSVGVIVYSNHISNLIQWQPNGQGGMIWTPVNIGKVRARGIENSFSYKMLVGNIVIQSALNYSYTRSTNENLDPASAGTYKKQLMYVPRHKATGTILFEYNKVGFYYSHQYTGLRYYLQDNSKYVPSYQIGNLSLYGNLRYKGHSFAISFTIQNIWDRSYEVIYTYPMPLRNYQISFQLNLNNL